MAERPAGQFEISGEDRIDAELLARVADRDRKALAELYHRYYHPLLRFIQRVTGDLEASQEGVNDVMLVVWTKASSFGGRSKVSTWIMGIAYRKAMKARLRLHKWASRFKAADWSETIEPLTGIDGLTEQVADRELIYRAIQQLPARQRAVIELTYVFGYSYREIAEIVECPENTVKTRMFHARNTLRKILPELGEKRSDD